MLITPRIVQGLGTGAEMAARRSGLAIPISVDLNLPSFRAFWAVERQRW
jgi:hypothetical protein